MLLRNRAVSSSKHSTGSRDLARKKKSMGLQETIALGCQGCRLLHELLLSELGANLATSLPQQEKHKGNVQQLPGILPGVPPDCTNP